MAVRPLTDITGYTTLRNDLMHLADEENKLRLALVELQKTKSQTIGLLVEAAEKLFMRSADEHDASGELRQEFRPETNVDAVADHVRPGRKCSNCGQPGHTVRTCSNPRLKHGDSPTEIAAAILKKTVKKARKPLSPERKAQLTEQLKKARASRRKK